MVIATMGLCITVAAITILQAIKINKPSILPGPIADGMATPVSLNISGPTGMHAHKVEGATHGSVLLGMLSANKLDNSRSGE
jgi:hypothetical protein